KGVVAAYKAAAGWKDFKNIVEEPVSVTPSTPSIDGLGRRTGTVDVTLNVPSDNTFTLTFTVKLPTGFVLNQPETKLTDALAAKLKMEMRQEADGSWKFTVSPGTGVDSRAATSPRKIMDIAYIVEETTTAGTYDVVLNDLTYAGSETFHADNIRTDVTIGAPTFNEAVAGSDGPKIFTSGGNLHIISAAAGTAHIYNVSGTLTATVPYQAGETATPLPQGVYIVRDSSGRTGKVVSIKN
ncbi:MAG: hypothetical protein LBJ01_02930, partial [Tannerella sp.]|nr:hypothetical protein [Tannerella sp.]